MTSRLASKTFEMAPTGEFFMDILIGFLNLSIHVLVLGLSFRDLEGS